MQYYYPVKQIDWNEKKSALLQKSRQICFDDVLSALNAGGLIETIEHPNRQRYAGQRIFVVLIKDYIYLVPFVEDEQKIFLKTIIPSRKATKKYLGKEKNENAT